MRAFVIRGFDEKKGVDFERVHRELIAPALTEAEIDGGDTTKVIVQAGNIRKDMYRELVMADVVVADVSLHNANVFYELGIRHALRPRSTVLIYTKIDEIPFDLLTDRYVSYDAASPAAARHRLVQVLRETLASEEADSPVFELLPEFVPGARTALLSLPRTLAEDIEQAREAKQAGELRLIADEVMGLRFEEAALRAVAKASEQAGDDIGAQRAWERVRDVHPDDYDANHALADIYRRGAKRDKLVRSDQALKRALGGRTLTEAQRAELLAGLASNSKRRWIEEWCKASGQERARIALQSPEREQALRFYQQGFDEDLNHSYSGLNALALAKVTLELAGRHPDHWRNRFETDAEADRALERLKSEEAALTCTVRAALDSARAQSRCSGDVDVWTEVSAADLRFLTSSAPMRVASAYQAAMSSRLNPGNRRSIREQVEMYRDLGIFTENVTPTLDLLVEPQGSKSTEKIHPLIFTGHMIDGPGRVRPRFPASQEETAKEKIKEEISAIKAAADRRQEQLIGMAGATDGGDLLFHEACAELDIDTEVFLPVPERDYRVTAMSGRSGWVERYHAVLTRAKEKAKAKEKEDGVHILANADRLPAWLLGQAEYSTWQRANQWVLHHAWATTTVDRVTVLALWNGEPGDGRGGTADMVDKAQAGPADVRVIETGKIFGLPGPQPPPQQPEPTAQAAPAPAAAGQDRPAGTGDSVLRKVWQKHQRWDDAAGAAQQSLNRWRLSNLALLVLGAFAAAFAAQTWLATTAVTALAAVSAAVLAAAGFIQGSMLTSDNMSRWTGARAASEALKAETCRYLAGVRPYAGPDRDERLQTQLDTVQTRAKDLLVGEQLATPGDDKLPPVDTFERYVENRAQEQADWHKKKVDEHRKKARALRYGQLAATAAGAVLAAIAGALPGAHLAAWTAAATTVAAAIATHIAATQHQRIAASYAATADQLERLIVGVDAKKASTDRQAQFVADVERVLAAQNNGWIDLLSTSHKTS